MLRICKLRVNTDLNPQNEEVSKRAAGISGKGDQKEKAEDRRLPAIPRHRWPEPSNLLGFNYPPPVLPGHYELIKDGLIPMGTAAPLSFESAARADRRFQAGVS